MARQKSRAQRWADAVLAARVAVDDLRAKLEDIGVIKDEYQDWRDSLPENLEASTLAEKLDEMLELEIDPDDLLLDVTDALDEADAADLPLGFGRD